MFNQVIPIKDQCLLIGNAVQGKAGIYFSCPPNFSSNTYTFILQFTKNRQEFPIRISVTEAVKTTNMRLSNEKPPFTIYNLIYKRYCERNINFENRIKKTATYEDLRDVDYLRR
jgi:hypothetical protein